MGDSTTRDPNLPPADLPTAGKELSVNRDKLKEIATELQKDLDALNTHQPGTYNDLTTGDLGLVTTAELGRYQAAEGLAGTCSNAYNVVGNTYQQLLTAYQTLIDTINQTANNYNKTEDATQQAATQAGSSTGTYTA